MLDVNVKGVFHLTQALAPALAAAGTSRNPSRVINIGSIDGIRVPEMDTYSYSASKAAVHHMTRVLARRLGRDNITVNAICPGPIETPSLASRIAGQADPDAVRARFLANQPTGRLGRAEEVAALAVYLASDEASYTTGQTHIIDGGLIG